MITEKQLKANQENAKLGGVKTEEGKGVSKYNALKHGIFAKSLIEKEIGADENDLRNLIFQEFNPRDLYENFLVNRLYVYMIQMKRVIEAERAFMEKCLGSSVSKTLDGLDYNSENKYNLLVKSEVEVLNDIYLRYEITIENRIIRIMERLQNGAKS